MPAGRAHKEEKKDSAEEAKPVQVAQVKPADLKKVGVQETGLAMTAGKSIVDYNKRMEQALKETE